LQVLNLSLGGTSANPVINQSIYANQLSYANASAVPDIVFVKAAGNSSCTINLSNCDPSNAVFYNSPQYKTKSIIVGGLTQAGGSMASYSNKAGTYSDIFLVADGRGIYDSTTGIYEQGTYFADPRVSGYAAILRQKFANLNAEKSASILLDTARFDTLTCHPNCDPTIYGKGEASLSRALAPVGRLR
jgi:subtilisin family serine protease